MDTADRLGFARFRQPEYTGENRCTPCTVVNVVIAALVSAVVGFLFFPAGVVVAVASVAAIYFRGYLVPGTPTLTKRYFPDRVLRWFDKSTVATVDTDLDVESQLLDLGVVEPDGDDLELTGDFRRDWQSAIDSVRGDPAERVGTLLDLDEPGIEDRGIACVVTDGEVDVARWPSEPALVADLAAIPALRRRADNWELLSRVEQGQLLSGLRIFLETCPSCNGPLSFDEEEVESCCRTVDVVTYDCDDCGARIFEVER